jgi:hypothetical protein
MMISSRSGPRPHGGGKDDRRYIYGYILEAFPRLGRAPTLDEISQDLQIGGDVVRGNLRALEADGALRLDTASGRILDAYPYSAVTTEHTVQIEGGPSLYSMCAIDAFYVPFLTESDVSVDSRCHYCGLGIHICVRRGAITGAEPSATVVWDSAATYDCPSTNFFCREEHLQLWLRGVPEEPGQMVDLGTALERGKDAAARIRGKIARPE